MTVAGEGPVSRVHAWLAQRRPAVFGAVLLLWVAALGAAQLARTDNTTLSFFPDSDTHMVRMAEAMDMAPFSRLLLIDFAAEDQGQAARLAATADAVLRDVPPELARRAAQFSLPEPAAFMRLLPALVDEDAVRILQEAVRPEAMRASLTEARSALSGLWGSVSVPWIQQDPLNFRRLFLQRLPAPPGVSLSDPNLGYPLSRDGKHVLLTLRPTRSFHDVEHAAALMDALNKAIATHAAPDMRVTVVGGHRHSAANAQSIQADISRIVLFSLAGFALVYLTLVRSLRGALWLLLTPLAAASLALGGVGLSWSVVSGLALGFGASVLGIAEDYAVHVHFALRCARARGEGAGAVLDALTLPLFQGFVLNATGFVVLLFSGIPALRHLAGFSLFTLGAGLLLALVVLPLCPGFDAPPLPAQHRTQAPRFPRRRPVLLCALLLFGLCAVLWQGIRMDMSPRSMGAGVAAMQEDGAMLKTVWGASTEQLWVVQGQDRAQTLEHTRHVAQALRRSLLPTGQDVDTLSDLWPAPEVMRANLIRWQNFVQAHPRLVHDLTALGREQGFAPNTFAPLALWLAEEAHPVDEGLLRAAGLGDMLDTFLEQGKDAGGQPRALGLIMVRGTAPATPHGPEDTLSPALPPELQTLAVALSPATLEAALLRHLQREHWLLPVAALLCVLLLRVCLGSARRTLLAALPPLTALAAILSWLCLTRTPLTLAGMAALPLVLGLAVDHGVVVTHDLAHGVNHGINRAILVSSLTALTGMGLLALAQHPALRSMGEIIFLGLLVEMLTALWLLPRLCEPERASS